MKIPHYSVILEYATNTGKAAMWWSLAYLAFKLAQVV